MSFPCPYRNCDRICSSSSGLTRHITASHREPTPASEPDSDLVYKTYTHPYICGDPCDINGRKLSIGTPPPPFIPLDATDENPYHPFPDRLAFEWAEFYFTEIQASAPSINKGLDLWLAESLRGGNDSVPWNNAEEMYATIDAIQQGNNPWETIAFSYNGSASALPEDERPQWMTATYELCTRNSRLLLLEQLACSDFDGHFDAAPYRQFNAKGDRVWSNLMSADWAAKQADILAEDQTTWGSMLVPVISGSDKTTVSVATGHQQYHPVYAGPGNIDNAARRGHSMGILPVAFLPIPKASKKERETVEYQRFCRQLYHACLARVFAPLKQSMTQPEVTRCPDGHYRRVIFSLGPYIADYPEQVWLAGIVQNWCAKCDSRPENLDIKSHLRSHEKTDYLVTAFDPGILWDEYGVRDDVVPFTHGFPRADIHELLTPDLLHQLIKGTFKDHLVEWVNSYLLLRYGRSGGLCIIQDIDRRISAVPAFSGLRRFPDGRDFNQWTGDDSKALMKVYIAAIAGHVPEKMVRCISAFMDCCYIVRRNAITSSDLQRFQTRLSQFHEYRQVFVETGVRKTVSLPRQHSLFHYKDGVELFGSPNGLCSSITESKHIKAVKEPWRRSNRYNALSQMLSTITRVENLSALRQIFRKRKMLVGKVSSYIAACITGDAPPILPLGEGNDDGMDSDEEDIAPVIGPRTLPSIKMAATRQRHYPRRLDALAAYINQPGLPLALRQFIFSIRHESQDVPSSSDQLPQFSGDIHVYHSAVACFYAPSDLCGAGGMYRQRIRANRDWSAGTRLDTALVVTDKTLPGMAGMQIVRILLFFSFHDPYKNADIPCALVNWFDPVGDEPDPDTGMWVVEPEFDGSNRTRQRPVQVIHLEAIFRGAHLLPCYGIGLLPEHFHYIDALDAFKSYYINHFIDHQMHEILTS